MMTIPPPMIAPMVVSERTIPHHRPRPSGPQCQGGSVGSAPHRGGYQISRSEPIFRGATVGGKLSFLIDDLASDSVVDPVVNVKASAVETS